MDLLPRDSQPPNGRGVVGLSMRGLASSAQHASLNTSAPAAGALIPSIDRGNLREKGRTPVSIARLRLFLGRYPQKEAVELLALGFAEGFQIPCRLTHPHHLRII